MIIDNKLSQSISKQRRLITRQGLVWSGFLVIIIKTTNMFECWKVKRNTLTFIVSAHSLFVYKIVFFLLLWFDGVCGYILYRNVWVHIIHVPQHNFLHSHSFLLQFLQCTIYQMQRTSYCVVLSFACLFPYKNKNNNILNNNNKNHMCCALVHQS